MLAARARVLGWKISPLSKKSENMWSMGLLNVLKDSKNYVISSTIAAVIEDKFPKAKTHYLICPKDDIATIYDLRREHLPLLDELHLLALNTLEVKQLRVEQFQMGFHAEPSMQQVHMHCISTDYVSHCLKTKKHWNSFNTRLFLPFEDVYECLQRDGCLRRLDKKEVKCLLSTELLCNQCSFVGKNMPTLKEHLALHWHDKAKEDTAVLEQKQK